MSLLVRIPSIAWDDFEFEIGSSSPDEERREIVSRLVRFLKPLVVECLPNIGDSIERVALRNQSKLKLKKIAPLWRYFARASAKATVESLFCGVAVARADGMVSDFSVSGYVDAMERDPFAEWSRLLNRRETAELSATEGLFLNPSLEWSEVGRLYWWDISGSGDLLLRSVLADSQLAVFTSCLAGSIPLGTTFCLREVLEGASGEQQRQLLELATVAVAEGLIAFDSHPTVEESAVGLEDEAFNTASSKKTDAFPRLPLRRNGVDACRLFTTNGELSGKWLRQAQRELSNATDLTRDFLPGREVYDVVQVAMREWFAGKSATIADLQSRVRDTTIPTLVERHSGLARAASHIGEKGAVDPFGVAIDRLQNNSTSFRSVDDIVFIESPNAVDSDLAFPCGFECSVRVGAESLEALDSGEFILVPEILASPGVLSNRFDHNFDRAPGLIAVRQYVDRITKRYPNSIVAEIATQRFGQNMGVNRYEPLGGQVFEPFCFRARRSRRGVVSRQDVTLRQQACNAEYGLFTGTQRMWLLSRNLYNYSDNTLFHLLMNLGSPQLEPDIRMLRGWLPVTADRFQPRVRIGRVVVRPATISVRDEETLSTFHGHPTAVRHAVSNLCSAYSMPRWLFFRMSHSTKPQLHDTHSLLSTDALIRTVRKCKPSWIEFQEMLPCPNQLWLRNAAGKRVVAEFVINS